MMKIFLIGYRCTGKSTIGKLLAERLNIVFFDTDRMVEQKTGSSILKIVAAKGWKKFRQFEKEMLFSIQEHKNYVMATGGGIITDSENRIFIKKTGICIWLDADLKTILHRLQQDRHTLESRPSLTSNNLFEETRQLMEKRKKLYKLTAQMRIDTGFYSPRKIAGIIDRRISDNVRQ